MSRIDQLIEELCPDGVRFQLLGLLCDSLKKGTLTQGQLLPDGEYPVMNSGRTFYGKFNQFNNDGNAIVVASRGEYAGFVSYIDQPFWAGGLCYPYRSKDENVVLTKFVYYALKNHENFIMDTLVARGSIPALNKLDIDKFLLPVPPLLVQEEIVRILDSFTQLEAELEAELEARKKQYEYYRDTLLSSRSGDIKNLGECCDFVRGPFGGSLKKEIFVSEGYAVYEQQHAIYGKYEFRYFITEEKFRSLKRFSVYPGDLIMSCSGTMGKISIVPAGAPEGVINQALLKLTPKPFIDAKYLKYYFESTLTKRMNEQAKGGAIKNVASVADLKAIEITVPPLEDQNRIVSLLDQFEAICTDINKGLPAEIEARHKQYEYYRDKLLTFKELEA